MITFEETSSKIIKILDKLLKDSASRIILEILYSIPDLTNSKYSINYSLKYII